ncbi:unnamed protein product, partial [Staurois parvus]
MWPTTSWLSCCCSHCFHFVIITLTVDCGIFSSPEMSRMDLLHSLSQMFCRSNLH